MIRTCDHDAEKSRKPKGFALRVHGLCCLVDTYIMASSIKKKCVYIKNITYQSQFHFYYLEKITCYEGTRDKRTRTKTHLTFASYYNSL